MQLNGGFPLSYDCYWADIARADWLVAHWAADQYFFVIGVLRDHLLYVLLDPHFEPRPEALFVEDMLAGCFDYIYTLFLFLLAFAAGRCLLEEVLADRA